MSCVSRLAIEPLEEKGQLCYFRYTLLATEFALFYMLVHRQKYQGPGLKAPFIFL